MREFFGIGGYTRPAEGYLSWQHLLFVSFLMAVMITLAVLLGRKNRSKPFEKKLHVLMVAAILIDSIELFKIVFLCFRSADPMTWIYELPLFLCSIQLITVPLAAFSKGRVRDAALDFVLIFGILGAVLGTYAAGNNYAVYPVLCFDNVVSGITHSISGFASLYIAISGLSSMKRHNIPITYLILTFFCVAAYVANHLISYNYMFLMRGDGTPYELLYSLVGGNPILYPLGVVILFLLYITAFYAGYHFFCLRRRTPKSASANGFKMKIK
ncbi:MAG: hypothetical protein E7666_01835 [Ruminococcaceae bacterium]|nr:hypothetical protein [Oscillospiraceae bacterium]